MTWTEDNEVLTADNPTAITNLRMLNQYFFAVFKHPCPSYECCESVYYTEAPNVTISDILITANEVHKVLISLDEDKATGPDKIPAKLLKNCASSISLSLSHLFNKSLVLGKLPSEWKLSNITPILKSGKPGEVTNYRPISLLSLVSKAFERCVFNKLIPHVSHQLHHLQFGFLKGKSTTAQLLEVLHDIGTKLDKRCQVDTLYLDFSKAFDKVNHKLLLTKLQRFDITGNLLRWLNDYLTDRKQRVTVLGETSQALPVLSGVPQGSILGPLLFLIYVNDLPASVSTKFTTALFANDTKCYRAVKTTEDGAELQRDLMNLIGWCNTWRMDLNVSKCGVLSFTRSHKPICYPYEHLGTKIKRPDTMKDLGITITDDLKWNRQVQVAAAKANKMLGFIRRSASGILDQVVRKSLYLAIVRSGMTYCSQVWAPQTVTNIQQLERVQRRATKFILSLPYTTTKVFKTIYYHFILFKQTL